MAAPYSVNPTPDDLLRMYGGDTQKLTEDMKAQKVPEDAGLFALMKQQRLEEQQAAAQTGQPTVLQQLLNPGQGQPPQGPSQGIGQPPQGMQMAASGGLLSAQIPQGMFAGGGMVGFANGGIPKREIPSHYTVLDYEGMMRQKWNDLKRHPLARRVHDFYLDHSGGPWDSREDFIASMNRQVALEQARRDRKEDFRKKWGETKEDFRNKWGETKEDFRKKWDETGEKGILDKLGYLFATGLGYDANAVPVTGSSYIPGTSHPANIPTDGVPKSAEGVETKLLDKTSTEIDNQLEHEQKQHDYRNDPFYEVDETGHPPIRKEKAEIETKKERERKQDFWNSVTKGGFEMMKEGGRSVPGSTMNRVLGGLSEAGVTAIDHYDERRDEERIRQTQLDVARAQQNSPAMRTFDYLLASGKSEPEALKELNIISTAVERAKAEATASNRRQVLFLQAREAAVNIIALDPILNADPDKRDAAIKKKTFELLRGMQEYTEGSVYLDYGADDEDIIDEGDLP